MKVFDRTYILIKRGMDLLLALVMLVVISPLFLLLMLLLMVTGERKVFYQQERVGYRLQKFHIIKYATMMSNSADIGTGDIVVENDFRVTRLGRFLRKTKLNELPQLINVIIGDMSLVGPRPLMPESFANYSPEVKEAIAQCKPGITGIGSVVFRNESQLVADSGMNPRVYYRQHIYPYKGTLEVWYYHHASLLTDIKILLLTAWVIFFPKSKMCYTVFSNLPQPHIKLA